MLLRSVSFAVVVLFYGSATACVAHDVAGEGTFKMLSATGSSDPTFDNAPARDGNIAIREEYDMAAQVNSVEAYQLFIDRHPQHPLAEKARQRLRDLQNKN